VSSRAAQHRAAGLQARYRGVRAATQAIAAPLSPEDCQVQSMPDVSPAKWHLAHVSWFFETFLLVPHLVDYAPFDPAFETLFNSYYVGVGARHPRPKRGLISRPTLDEVQAYRRHVDEAMERLLAGPAGPWLGLVELGLHHEQQHQELMWMDIQHVLSCNPIDPSYGPGAPAPSPAAEPLRWIQHPGGVYAIGHDGNGFAFDNESPRHRVWLEPFRIGSRLVTNGEYAEFIADGGYRKAELWLSDGWDTVVREGWIAPLYWRAEADGRWSRFSLAGRHLIDPEAPVLHLSYYEADAFARWAGARLPTEAEWEVAALAGGLDQLDDCAWQWTGSAYLPYPGFKPAPGAVGEYNGKFMVNQIVLRGGACATPAGHARPTYRNFFPPHSRWMFAGLRLAQDD
jgi:ergothioneine biosynthesis protein EgtB